MRRLGKITLILLCLAFIFTSLTAVKKQTSKNKKNLTNTEQQKPAQPELKVNQADILAEFKGGLITKQDLENKINKLPAQAQAQYKTVDGQKQLLEMMTVEEVFYQKAKDLNVMNDPVVKDKINNAKKQVLVQEYYTRNVKNKVTLTEAEKQDFYKQNLTDFYVAPYISIKYLQPADEANAQKAIRELNKGASFVDVLGKYNINTYAKNINGVIKNIRLNGNLPGIGNDADLENLIKNSPVDTLHFLGPQQTSTGWSIIQVIEKVEGRQRPYLECEQEVDQRLRPKRENETLNQLVAAQKALYHVQVDSLLAALVNLREPDKNTEIANRVLVTASDPSMEMTVQALLNKYKLMAPQEQMLYVKGGGAMQMINQDLNRNLMYLDASKDKSFDEFLNANEDFKQAQRYYVLQETYKKLVVDSLTVMPDEMRAFYDTHLQDYTTPSARKILAVWPKDAKTATVVQKKLAKAVKANNQKAIDKLVANYSVKPELKIMDNLYNNGIVLSVGADQQLSELIWKTPVGKVSPVTTTVKKDPIVFQVLEERPAVVKSYTEVEPRLQGQLKKEKEKARMESVKQQLFTQYNLRKYEDKLVIKLSADELFSLADDSARQRKFKDATVYYDQIIQFYPDGENDYKASFMKAFLITEEMGNKEQGLQLFKDFLKKYPQGELNDSAQYMIDELEGKAPQLEDVEPQN